MFLEGLNINFGLEIDLHCTEASDVLESVEHRFLEALIMSESNLQDFK